MKLGTDIFCKPRAILITISCSRMFLLLKKNLERKNLRDIFSRFLSQNFERFCKTIKASCLFYGAKRMRIYHAQIKLQRYVCLDWKMELFFDSLSFFCVFCLSVSVFFPFPFPISFFLSFFLSFHVTFILIHDFTSFSHLFFPLIRS
jgi:hypothetical protein